MDRQHAVIYLQQSFFRTKMALKTLQKKFPILDIMDILQLPG